MPNRATIGEPVPSLFVSDLYVPATEHVEEIDDFSEEERKKQEELARAAAHAFTELYPGPRHAKRRMRQTMAALVKGRDLLDKQWQPLRQSPDHGLEILHLVRREFPELPFVFYSRKITPDDVMRVLKQGARDAIQKREWQDRGAFIERLEEARGRRRW